MAPVDVTRKRSLQTKACKEEMDPRRYQFDTLPEGFRAEFQQVPLHRYSDEEMRPPPGFGVTPEDSRAGSVTLGKRRVALVIVALLAIVLAITLAFR